MIYNPKLLAFAAEYFKCGSRAEAAKAVKVSDATAKRYLGDPAVKDYLQMFQKMFSGDGEVSELREQYKGAVADVGEILKMYTEILRGREEERVLIQRSPEFYKGKAYMTEKPVKVMVSATNADRIKAGKELMAYHEKGEQNTGQTGGVIILAEVKDE